MFPMLVRMGSDSSRKTFGFPEAQVFQKTAKSTVDQTDWPSASSVQMSQSWSRVSELVWNRASPKSGMRQGTEEEVERVFRRITTSWAGSVWHKHFCTMFSFVMNLSMNSRNAKKKKSTLFRALGIQICVLLGSICRLWTWAEHMPSWRRRVNRGWWIFCPAGPLARRKSCNKESSLTSSTAATLVRQLQG